MSAAVADGDGLPDWALEALRAIGLTDPDPDDALHVRLVNAVLRLGPAAARGVQLSAMRFEFAWELRAAGAEFATTKTDYEHRLAKSKAALMLKDGFSGVKAQAVAEADDELYGLLLRFRLAELRERSVRKFLDAIETAVDTWRTQRADERAADRASAQGYAGGA
ncbi:hypothetical protein ACXR2W_00940 [Leucobacter sp. HY1908]